MKIKTILVSQPTPTGESSPYFELAENVKVKIDFQPFIHIEGVNPREVRKQKIDLHNYTAIVLTSRNAVDHFFRIAEEMRYQVPINMKYFCLSEAVAFYLQRYIVYRKRKIYVGNRTMADLSKVIKKHKEESFLLLTSDKLKSDIPEALDKLKIKWDRAILYKTVVSNLSALEDVFYDILVFFSPSGIDSLYKNFPGYKQKKTIIAVYGNTTKEAAEKAGLVCNIIAPTKEAPSMTMALENFIKEANKR